MRHRLVDNCVRVEREHGGVTAECTCGWISRGHFSGMGASAAFQDHKERSENNPRDTIEHQGE